MNFITKCNIVCRGNIYFEVNSDYQTIGSFIKNIPHIFDIQGETIYCGRNHIKVYEIDGKRINVKKYTIPPYFFNRIIYILFREPKAKRAYDYALKLQSMGVDTPTPIGYYLQKKGLLLSECYLVTEHEDNAYKLADIDNVESNISEEDIFSEFGRYTATLHKKGVFHNDYSMGNVLFCIEQGMPKFLLIDINRMDFHKPTFETCCKNFHRLNMDLLQFRIVINSYAKAMNYDIGKTCVKIISSRNKTSKMLNIKRWIRESDWQELINIKSVKL